MDFSAVIEFTVWWRGKISKHRYESFSNFGYMKRANGYTKRVEPINLTSLYLEPVSPCFSEGQRPRWNLIRACRSFCKGWRIEPENVCVRKRIEWILTIYHEAPSSRTSIWLLRKMLRVNKFWMLGLRKIWILFLNECTWMTSVLSRVRTQIMPPASDLILKSVKRGEKHFWK